MSNRFIVFKFEDWPLAVYYLRRRFSWRVTDLLITIDEVIEALEGETPDPKALAAILKRAAVDSEPPARNPMRWAFAVNVAESQATGAYVVPDQKMTTVQRAVLEELGATRSHQSRCPDSSDPTSRANLLKQASDLGMLNGMDAHD